MGRSLELLRRRRARRASEQKGGDALEPGTGQSHPVSIQVKGAGEGAELAPAASIVLRAPAESVVLALREPALPEDVFEHFVRGRNANTLAAYQQDLKHFARYLGVPDARAAIAVLFRLDAGQANRAALGWLQSMSASPATCARRLSALRSMVKLGRTLGLISWAIDVEGPKVQSYRDTRGPGISAIHRLYGACGGGLIGARDRAIVALMAGQALRRGEIARSQRKDYDRERGVLSVVGKGGKEAHITLADETREALDAWIDAAGVADGSLFYSLSTKSHRTPLAPEAVWEIVQRLGKIAGVRTWPHGIRHTSITTVADETRDLQKAQRFARHDHVQTTMIYLDNVKDEAGEAARVAASVLIPKGK